MSTLSSVTDGQLCDEGTTPGCPPKVVVQDNSSQTVVAPTTTRVVADSRQTATVTLRQSSPVVVSGSPAPAVVVSSATQRVLATGGQQGVQGPAGDVGPAGPPGASAGQPVTTSYVSAHPTPLLRGMPVCVVSGQLRRATSIGPYAEAVGLVYDEVIVEGAAGRVQTGGTMTLTALEWDAVTDMLGGLAPEQTHFLTATGAMTPFPAEDAGQYIAPIGYAVSATEFLIDIDSRILL